MSRLTERAKVKDFAQIARADTLYDPLINSMIEQASAEVERLTRRKFEKEERVEYHQSYDQSAFDPEPQIIALDAFPVDEDAGITLEWSAFDHKENSSILLDQSKGNYRVDPMKGFIWVRSAGGTIGNLPLIGSVSFTYATRGFKVTYTGGFEVTSESGGHVSDPLDDFGVTEVPEGLKTIVAQKVARDLKEVNCLRPFTDEESRILNPWKKKDQI